MPRVARKISISKVYHIILRGNDRQDIFFEEQDYRKFLKLVNNAKEKYQYEIYTYCLMTNHVHLIVYDKNNQISKIMQSMEVAYSSYFAKKYGKEGHLFQNRFLSKNVESKEYLYRLCKYIHQNPLKAGISKTEKYKWSSYQEFVHGSKIINSEVILSMFGENKKEAIENFIIFHSYELKMINEEIEYECLNRLTDEQVKDKIQKILNVESLQEFNIYDRETRNKNLQKLKVIKGTSKVQLARVLGINRKILERAMK